MSTYASLLPARTPRSAFGKLLQSETKVAWRVPLGLVLGAAVPVLVLVIFGTIPAMTNLPALWAGWPTSASALPPTAPRLLTAGSTSRLLSPPTPICGDCHDIPFPEALGCCG